MSFVGLVSCLNRSSLHVVCVQETQAPDIGTLSTDQPFGYDDLLGSYGREAGFLFHASVESTSIAGIEDSQSLRWRSVTGVACVCSLYAPHVGIAVDVHVAFWRTFGCLASACLAVSFPLPFVSFRRPTFGF